MDRYYKLDSSEVPYTYEMFVSADLETKKVITKEKHYRNTMGGCFLAGEEETVTDSTETVYAELIEELHKKYMEEKQAEPEIPKVEKPYLIDDEEETERIFKEYEKRMAKTAEKIKVSNDDLSSLDSRIKVKDNDDVDFSKVKKIKMAYSFMASSQDYWIDIEKGKLQVFGGSKGGIRSLSEVDIRWIIKQMELMKLHEEPQEEHIAVYSYWLAIDIKCYDGEEVFLMSDNMHYWPNFRNFTEMLGRLAAWEIMFDLQEDEAK